MTKSTHTTYAKPSGPASPGRRKGLSKSQIQAQADAAPGENLITGLVTAAIYVASADHHVDSRELHQLSASFRATPLLAGFSHDELAAEIATRIGDGYVTAPVHRSDMLEELALLSLTPREADLILCACRTVVIADGAVRPVEIAALNEVEAVLQRLAPGMLR